MFSLLPLALLAACTTVQAGEGRSSRLFVGVVRVVMPERKGDVTAIEVKALGIGWDSGPFIGWRAGSWITADPAKCQLLIIIRSPAQAENAAKVIQSLEGQEPCIADFTHTLRP